MPTPLTSALATTNFDTKLLGTSPVTPFCANPDVPINVPLVIILVKSLNHASVYWLLLGYIWFKIGRSVFAAVNAPNCAGCVQSSSNPAFGEPYSGSTPCVYCGSTISSHGSHIATSLLSRARIQSLTCIMIAICAGVN